jgi:hypothetical protein
VIEEPHPHAGKPPSMAHSPAKIKRENAGRERRGGQARDGAPVKIADRGAIPAARGRALGQWNGPMASVDCTLRDPVT